MRHFLKRMLRALFGPPGGHPPSRAGPATKARELHDKIRKWERQAEEYEARGLTELVRRSRESLGRLPTLDRPTTPRRVA